MRCRRVALRSSVRGVRVMARRVAQQQRARRVARAANIDNRRRAHARARRCRRLITDRR